MSHNLCWRAKLEGCWKTSIPVRNVRTQRRCLVFAIRISYREWHRTPFCHSCQWQSLAWNSQWLFYFINAITSTPVSPCVRMSLLLYILLLHIDGSEVVNIHLFRIAANMHISECSSHLQLCMRAFMFVRAYQCQSIHIVVSVCIYLYLSVDICGGTSIGP